MTDKLDDREPEEKEESFAELFESFESNVNHDIRQGDKIEGTIISIGKESVYIGTGTKSDGVVSKAELLDKNGEFPHKAGDHLTLYVVSKNESEIILSKAMSGAGMASMLEDAFHSRTPVEGKVSEAIKGGFAVTVMGKRAFCPISQMDVKYVEKTEEYLGEIFHFLITRYEEGGRNIVISRREILNLELAEKREAFFKTVSQGDILDGQVTKLMAYGAFIEISPGIEGMAHISELSWSRVEKPDEVIKVGDQVRVKILSIIEKEEGKAPQIALSIKQIGQDPWETVNEKFKTGDQVTGKVVRLAPFGAFVELFPGLDGLVHISEMSYTKRIIKADDVVSAGETVGVVIKGIDPEKKRISLSIRDALGDPWTGVSRKYTPGTLVEGVVEKKETFGIFITLEEGVTGLLPSSSIKRASDTAPFDKLKPGDTVKVLVENTDEDQRRISLAPPDLKEGDNWKHYAKPEKKTMGTMGDLLMEALKKNQDK